MKTIFLNVTVLMGLAGLVYVLRLDRVSGVVLLLIVVIYPLPNYLIHVGLRQEYPLHWLMTLLSAALIIGLLTPKHVNLTYMPSRGLAARRSIE